MSIESYDEIFIGSQMSFWIVHIQTTTGHTIN